MNEKEFELYWLSKMNVVKMLISEIRTNFDISADTLGPSVHSVSVGLNGIRAMCLEKVKK